jgi:ATP-dependent DNA helicase RecG
VSGSEDPSAPQPPPGCTLTKLAGIEVGVLKGVGPKRIAALGHLGVSSVLDLLWTYPRRYIDRTRQADLADLVVGDEAVVLGRVTSVSGRRTQKGRALVTVVVDDGTGSMQVTFFNQAWREGQLAVGTEALFFGKLEEYAKRPKMTNPVVDVLMGMTGQAEAGTKTLRIVPVYPQSQKSGVTSWDLGRMVAESLRRAGTFADPIPTRVLDELDLLDRTSAMWGIHAPETLEEAAAARRRLAFDELLRLQLTLQLRRAALEADARGLRHVVDPREVGTDDLGAATMVSSFLAALPFAPTAAQRRVMAEVLGDLAGPLPMHRLLQGDVGSGKTVVALAALLGAVQGGHQGALMAPTEVLADQHHQSVRALLEGLEVPDASVLGGVRPVSAALLTGSRSARERRAVIEGLAQGTVDIVIGTHALLTDDVSFRSLGLAVVDEQHRFGVEQRAALREKGRGGDGEGHDPDLLVMTATPIPRSAAMVVFGDLSMSVLDELPAGRAPITTRWLRTGLEEAEAWGRVRDEVAAGRQAYVVCPLVEGSAKVEATSATEEAERLAATELAGLRVGLLHGQMKTAEKDEVMEAFRSGDLDVLVATTVIEVGVDVPAATVMVIEDAGRFGIAQLHQLRGRVGRGGGASWCYLLGEATSADASVRLEAMEQTTDGFVLAEVDLEVRGEGTILGSRQKGRSDLALASLARDRDLLEQAAQVAVAMTADDPHLVGHPLLVEELRTTLDPEDAAFLFKG